MLITLPMLIHKRGLPQCKIARLAGITPAFLSQIISQERGMSQKTAAAIARVTTSTAILQDDETYLFQPRQSHHSRPPFKPPQARGGRQSYKKERGKHVNKRWSRAKNTRFKKR